jgi:hypothetical protein
VQSTILDQHLTAARMLREPVSKGVGQICAQQTTLLTRSTRLMKSAV